MLRKQIVGRILCMKPKMPSQRQF